MICSNQGPWTFPVCMRNLCWKSCSYYDSCTQWTGYLLFTVMYLVGGFLETWFAFLKTWGALDSKKNSPAPTTVLLFGCRHLPNVNVNRWMHFPLGFPSRARRDKTSARVFPRPSQPTGRDSHLLRFPISRASYVGIPTTILPSVHHHHQATSKCRHRVRHQSLDHLDPQQRRNRRERNGRSTGRLCTWSRQLCPADLTIPVHL